ncbi:MAG: hypothetical protein H0X62_12155 [Bacteroidetes bacterium]|nr:hypothetical protein [Bacteroidota bacterium]
MKQKLLFLFLFLTTLLVKNEINAQTVLSTTSSFLNNNSNGTVTFNLQNTNVNDVMITDIAGITGTSGTVNVEFYYNPIPVSGAPGNINAANGWVLVETNTITGIANTTTTTTQPFISGMNFIIPANTTYGIAIFATGQRYFTLPPGSTTIAADGINMLAGDNISYAGGVPPAAPTNSPRGWIGEITIIPTIACSGTPTPGTTVVSGTTACLGGSVDLSLTGSSYATGLSFQWQSSANGISWTNIPTATSFNFTATISSDTYFRCEITCSGTSAYSNSVLVNTLTTISGGTYTIGTSGDYPDFASVANALNCGINGPVTFNVLPGVYNEQIIINDVPGASATNTVTFDGIDITTRKITFNSTTSADRHTIRLNGAKFVRIKNLTIENTSTSNAFVVHMTNGCEDIELTSNHIIVDNQAASSTAYGGIVASGSLITATSTGNSVNKLLIQDNTILNGYYGIVLTGISTNRINDIQIINNEILNSFYF